LACEWCVGPTCALGRATTWFLLSPPRSPFFAAWPLFLFLAVSSLNSLLFNGPFPVLSAPLVARAGTPSWFSSQPLSSISLCLLLAVSPTRSGTLASSLAHKRARTETHAREFETSGNTLSQQQRGFQRTAERLSQASGPQGSSARRVLSKPRDNRQPVEREKTALPRWFSRPPALPRETLGRHKS